MAALARRAGVSTGNIYRYFADKDALFTAVLPDEFAARLLRLLQRRVSALVRADDLSALDDDAQARAEELLGFWIEHRLQVVTLLDRAHGSRHEGFCDQFVRELVRASKAKLRHGSRRRLPREVDFLLEQIFRNTVRSIVAILENHPDERDIRRAFQGFWSYQLAGLAGFDKWVQS